MTRLPLARTSLHMAAAFVLMGGWALVANRSHAMPAPLVAGAVQGSLSAGLTGFLKIAVEWLSTRSGSRFLPPVVALGGSATLLVTAHVLAGTPEVAATIAVPLIVSGTYVFTLSHLLHRSPP